MNKIVNVFSLIILISFILALLYPLIMGINSWYARQAKRRVMNKIEKLLESGKEKKVLEKIRYYNEDNYDIFALEKALEQIEK